MFPYYYIIKLYFKRLFILDPVLLAYIETPTEQSAENYLALILNAGREGASDRPDSKVIDAVRRAVLSCWRVRPGQQDTDFVGEEQEAAEATFSEARLRMMLRLRHLRLVHAKDPAAEVTAQSEGITDLAAYAYRLTMNTAADILREAYPDRYRLDCALRYIVRNSARLAIWYEQEKSQKRKQWIGLQQWNRVRSDKPGSCQESVYHAYLEGARQRWALVSAYAAGPENLSLEEVCVVVLNDIGGPISMQDFRYILAVLRGVLRRTESYISEYNQERPLAEQDSWRMPAQATSAYYREQSAGRVTDIVVLRTEAEFLWKEICLLLPLQRRALLLNPRGTSDSGDIMTLLVTLGIATEVQIAASMDMQRREFEQIWQEMPLEDTVIAQRLMPPDTTGRDVSNLRKSAIDRLTRRRKVHFALPPLK